MSDLPRGSPQSFQVSRGETLETGIAMVSNQPGGSLSADDQIAVSWQGCQKVISNIQIDLGLCLEVKRHMHPILVDVN